MFSRVNHDDFGIADTFHRRLARRGLLHADAHPVAPRVVHSFRQRHDKLEAEFRQPVFVFGEDIQQHLLTDFVQLALGSVLRLCARHAELPARALVCRWLHLDFKPGAWQRNVVFCGFGHDPFRRESGGDRRRVTVFMTSFSISVFLWYGGR